MNRIIVKNGLLWRGNAKRADQIIDVFEADRIAQANGFSYAEGFVNNYKEGTKLFLNDDFVVTDNKD